MLLFSRSVQVAFLQHGQTERHILDDEHTAVSERSYDGASGPNLPIMVLKWKPQPHSHFDGCLRESAVMEEGVSSPKWEPAQLSPTWGLSRVSATPTTCPHPPSSRSPQDERLLSCRIQHLGFTHLTNTLRTISLWMPKRGEAWKLGICGAFHEFAICQEPSNTIALNIHYSPGCGTTAERTV